MKALTLAAGVIGVAGVRPLSKWGRWCRFDKVVSVDRKVNGLVCVVSGFVALLFFLTAGVVVAHPVSLTSALVNVEEEKVTLEIDVMVEDLVLYHRIDTDQEFSFSYRKIEEQAREHVGFLLKYIHVRDEEGRKLEGELVSLEMDEVPEEGVHIEDLMLYSMVYHFEYPLDGRPAYLTIAQEFDGEDAALPAEMDVQFFHHGVFMESAGLSHRTAMTVELDWDAGWEDVEDEMAAAREHLQERREQQLGITSYSAVYSYVYITDYAVRHEVLVPLLTLETWLPLEREDPEWMTIAEQRAAHDDISAFFKEKNRVEINGIEVEPELERLSFYGPDIRDFALQAPERDVSVFNARVGIILTFPSDAPPREMRFGWDHFDNRMPVLAPRVYPFDGERINAVVDYYRPFFEWETVEEHPGVELLAIPVPDPPPVWQLPLLSLAAGGISLVLLAMGLTVRAGGARRLVCVVLAAGFASGVYFAYPYARVSVAQPFAEVEEMGEEDAREVFAALQENIYRAFRYHEEERIYDALAESVAGQLLEDLYLQIRRSLQMREQGGAVAAVEDIEILEGSIRDEGQLGEGNYGFSYQCRWTVTGTLEHWGHIHTRQNLYDAVFTVEAGEEGWRITSFEPFSEEPVMMQLRIRD